MCDLFDCHECRHGCKFNATDREIEKLWKELEDVPVYENENLELCIDKYFQGWYKGIDLITIWHWFDKKHSKGVGWLMNEYEE